MLQLFKQVLREEFANADRQHMGSFMRGNTAITQMLSAYARRPGSLKMLKFVLGDVLEARTQVVAGQSSPRPDQHPTGARDADSENPSLPLSTQD